MNIPEIAKCPNPECGAAMGRLISLQGAWLECSACGYSSPKSDSVEKAIHLHNAICRQPTPEAADNEPDFNLWTRIAFYAIKAAEKQNGVRLIPMGDEDAEAFMESIDCALQESLDEILETDSDEPAHPPKPEPTEADAEWPENWHGSDQALESAQHMVDKKVIFDTPESLQKAAQIIQNAIEACADNPDSPLIEYFRTDGYHEYGWHGDEKGLSPEETAIYFLRERAQLGKHVPAAPKPPAEWMAEAAREIRAAYVAFSVGAGAQPMYDHIERIIAKHFQHAPKVPEGEA